jgi:hypothetical protein
MRRLVVPAVLALLAVASAAAPASAEDLPARRIELAASVGYAAPFGDAEQGSRVSDTAFGAVPFTLDGSYRLTSLVGVALRVRYGVAIPTLCASASDCQASLGSDLVLGAGARFHLPRVWVVSPFVDVGLGYEWLTTRLVDAGATSTRSYGGPVLAELQLAAPFALGERLTLGPELGASIGRFVHYDLGTNALSPSGSVPSGAVHAWLSLGVRLGFAL